MLGVVATGGSMALAGCVGLFPEPESSTVPQDETDTGDDVDTGLHDVEYLVQEETIQVESDENLLEAGEEQGWDLPYQCRSGFCGQCLARVEGDGHELVEMTSNEYDPLDDDAVADGYVLTCTGQPRGDFAIETGVEGALAAEQEEQQEDEEDETDDDAETHAIEYVKQDATIDVATDENLLEAGEEQGWDLPYQCRVGVCGECTAKVDGDGHELVEMTDNQVLDDDEIEDGYVLTCTGQPREEFAIETTEQP